MVQGNPISWREITTLNVAISNQINCCINLRNGCKDQRDWLSCVTLCYIRGMVI